MLGARPGLVAGLLVKMEKGDRFSRPDKRDYRNVALESDKHRPEKRILLLILLHLMKAVTRD